jgi:teichuronic acid biosynthesis glycosyltransferase TuaC
MKVLFISSGNSKLGISPIIKNQGESLRKAGVDVSYYLIKGKGFRGYLKSIKPLKNFIKQNKVDIVHAHYSMSAFVGSLAGVKPLVVSLMGSDVQGGYLSKLLIKIFYKLSWKTAIVKSVRMYNHLDIKKVFIIPNGVDTEVFNSMDKRDCQKQLGWDYDKKHILFAANPSRPEKNYALAKEAFSILNNENIEFHSLIDVLPKHMPLWMNSADVVFLSSLREGSPNVIKEAMACNRPIVSTDVGDIKEVIENTKGCYLTSFDPRDIADKINMSISFGKETNGIENIKHLESSVVAKKIINIYIKVLEK